MKTSAVIVASHPLFRMAVADLLRKQKLSTISEETSTDALFLGYFSDTDLLVICVEEDDTALIDRLIGRSRLIPASVVLFTPVFGKRHAQLLRQQRVDLCLPLAVPCSVAEEYLRRLLAPGWGDGGEKAIADRRLSDRFMPDLTDLSNNERRVLYHLQQGLSNQAIAERMNVQPNTVKVHLSRACRKAGFISRTQAAQTTRDFLSCGRGLHYRVA